MIPMYSHPSIVAPAAWAYCAIDIETANGSPDDAELHIRSVWASETKAIGSWKEETIGKRLKEAWAKRKEQLALLDGAPIVVVCLKSDTELRCLHTCSQQEPRMAHGGLVEGFETQEAMLVALRALLDHRASAETVLTGHNLIKFDLPKLRHAYVRLGLRLPVCLEGYDQPVYDTMSAFKRFTVEGKNTMFVSLDTVLESFGMDSHKGIVDGSQVPMLYETGRHEELISYALLDILLEAQLFERMTGRWEQLK